ncbi:hypothetical protein V6N13_072025 [Hibiscus sabdariffa]
MNMEDRMATIETNHHFLQDKFEKFEKDLKEEIAQAQQNTMGQIVLMLGLPDPRRGKVVEESIPVGNSPYIPEKTSHHDREQSGMGTLKAKVKFNAGLAESVPINSGITHNHYPEMEIPKFDEVDDKSKTEMEIPNFDEVDDKSKTERKLEDRCEKLEELVRSMQNVATLGGIYARELSLVNDLVIPPKFKDSLVGSAAHWYTQLSWAHIKTWRDLSKAFLEQYNHVSDMVPSRTVLQTMEQKANESFRQYAQRWRDITAQVQPPLLENEITLLFVNTLKDFYDRVLDHATKPFADMVSGHPNGIIVGQPNHVATPRASAQNSSKQEARSRGEKKEKPSFTPIPIRCKELFPRLVESHLVAPRYIAPIQPPYPPWFNPNVKCDYHVGNPGQHINDCTAFKYVVEQLLKAGMLSFEAPEKNPMTNYKGVNALIEGSDMEVKENLGDVTTPLKWVWNMLVENEMLKACRSTSSTSIKAPATAISVIVIKTPAPFPYKDSKQVPWKYECEVSEPQKAEENVNEVGNFTRSERCYSAQPQAELTKNQKEKAHDGGPDKKFDDEPEPEYHEPVKESEAK